MRSLRPCLLAVLCLPLAAAADPHLVNVLDVLDVNGRTAAVVEWAAGLPGGDWPAVPHAGGGCPRQVPRLLWRAAARGALLNGAHLPFVAVPDGYRPTPRHARWEPRNEEPAPDL